MSLEDIIRDEFMAGRSLGMEQGIKIVQEVMDALFKVYDGQPLSYQIVMGSIDACLTQTKEINGSAHL